MVPVDIFLGAPLVSVKACSIERCSSIRGRFLPAFPSCDIRSSEVEFLLLERLEDTVRYEGDEIYSTW
jgi:hypothetical protein